MPQHICSARATSLAAVIANEFGEAQGLHRSALFAAGLVLFVLTLLVNAIARLLVLRAARARAPKLTAQDRAENVPPAIAGTRAGSRVASAVTRVPIGPDVAIACPH